MAELSFVRRNGEAIVTGIITTCIVAGAVALYDKYPSLLAPFTYISVCGMAALVSCSSLIALRRIPKPSPKPNSDNIEEYVRGWLDAYGLTVRKDPSDAMFFRYQVTLPAPDSENLTIFRMKIEEPQYIQVYADMSMSKEQGQKLVNGFSPERLSEALFDLKLELARVRIGYSGLVIPPLDFRVFRKVYIHPEMRETDFYNAIHEVEASIHLVGVVYLRLLQEGKQQDNPSAKPPASASDTQALELPPASS